jgi:hypothetical protein
MVRQPPAANPEGIGTGLARRRAAAQQFAASTPKLAASAPITQPGPTSAVRPPASAGPTTIATCVNVDSSALPVTRSSSGSSSATRVYAPAFPQACNSDETESNTTYPTGFSSPAADRIATRPSATARSAASSAISCALRNRRTSRASRAAPIGAGSAYAATASPVHTPAWSGGASCTASQATATMLIPSPRAETSMPGRTRRSTGCRTTRPTEPIQDRVPVRRSFM